MSDNLNIYSKIKYLGNHSLNRIADINKKSEKLCGFSRVKCYLIGT